MNMKNHERRVETLFSKDNMHSIISEKMSEMFKKNVNSPFVMWHCKAIKHMRVLCMCFLEVEFKIWQTSHF